MSIPLMLYAYQGQMALKRRFTIPIERGLTYTLEQRKRHSREREEAYVEFYNRPQRQVVEEITGWPNTAR